MAGKKLKTNTMKKQYSKIEAYKMAVNKRGVNNIQTLQRQSLVNYQLKKDTALNLYWIERQKDKKKTVLMDRDEAEEFILYGLSNKECLTLKFE